MPPPTRASVGAAIRILFVLMRWYSQSIFAPDILMSRAMIGSVVSKLRRNSADVLPTGSSDRGASRARMAVDCIDCRASLSSRASTGAGVPARVTSEDTAITLARKRACWYGDASLSRLFPGDFPVVKGGSRRFQYRQTVK